MGALNTNGRRGGQMMNWQHTTRRDRGGGRPLEARHRSATEQKSCRRSSGRVVKRRTVPRYTSLELVRIRTGPERDKYATGVVSGAVVRVANDPRSGVEPDLLPFEQHFNGDSDEPTVRPTSRRLRGHLLWLASNYLGGASVASLIDSNSTTVSVTTISIVLPLLLLTYLIHDARIENANRHVDQLNRMYMSAIETFGNGG